MSLSTVRPHPSGSWRAVILAVAAGALLAGCSTAATAPATPSASTRTSSSPTVSASPTPAPAAGRVDAREFFDELERRARAEDTVQVIVDSPYMFLNGSWQESTKSAHLLLHDADRWLNVVIIGHRVYTSDENVTAGPWSRVKDVPDGVEGSSVANQIAQWRSRTRSVTRGSTVVVEGHRLTSYVLVVPAAQAYAAVGLVAPRGVPATMAVTLRLDEDGLPRDAKATMEGDPLTIEYTGWGADLEVVAPPLG